MSIAGYLSLIILWSPTLSESIRSATYEVNLSVTLISL